ncbi:hypothetical protein KY290_001175 [Solanum tuberosum]|uniref:Uncharacterized protein n=1 Tax=Solanum tuberosum TaxID=4113 RepID=A0ABQ7WNM7_SOLTU|nr:hypothetical protein KY290_001175 [Solanum tuberosum]
MTSANAGPWPRSRWSTGSGQPRPFFRNAKVGDPSLRECRAELANAATKSLGLPKRVSKPANVTNKLRCTMKGCTSSS